MWVGITGSSWGCVDGVDGIDGMLTEIMVKMYKENTMKLTVSMERLDSKALLATKKFCTDNLAKVFRVIVIAATNLNPTKHKMNQIKITSLITEC